MKQYFRLMLGKSSKHAETCFGGEYVGVDFGIHEDLAGHLPEQWREFNKQYIPVFLKNRPDKSRIAAGLACGAIWTVAKGMADGDIVLCPDGSGNYHVGEVAGCYSYADGDILPHRRPVRWLGVDISREEMSDGLKNSTGAINTVSNITQHAEEIEQFLKGSGPPPIISTDKTVVDPAAFALEKHLEDFLVANWSGTELGQKYDIYSDDTEAVGQQFPTDTGPIDILAASKDKTELLVIELKKGRASDAVVGQLLRYMGYVQEVLAEAEQTVKGAIIALEDDLKIRRALAMTPAIDFYRYQISFELVKA